MELRECPFCGGEAHVREIESPYVGDASFFRILHHCRALGYPIESRLCETREEAARAWNCRKKMRPKPTAHAPVDPPAQRMRPLATRHRTRTRLDPLAQHYPCGDCPFDPSGCKAAECERLKRYEAAREATP